jgi:hypothetical protein
MLEILHPDAELISGDEENTNNQVHRQSKIRARSQLPLSRSRKITHSMPVSLTTFRYPRQTVWLGSHQSVWMTQVLQISPDSSFLTLAVRTCAGPAEDAVLSVLPDETVRPVFRAPGLEGLGVSWHSRHRACFSWWVQKM